MNRGNANYIGFVNSNPKVPLSQAIENAKIELATYAVIKSDETLVDTNNAQTTEGNSLPFSITFNMSGTVSVVLTIAVYEGYLHVYKNDVFVGLLQDANSPLIVDIERGDSLTFSVTGIAAETTGKLYANSLFILGTIIKIGKYGLIEVIE